MSEQPNVEHNKRAFKLIEGRFSDQVKSFNSGSVGIEDSDAHYFAVTDRLKLARIALGRAPELFVGVRVLTLSLHLGDIYRSIRKHLTPDELARWERLDQVIEDLMDEIGES
ncbi:hypothetical protein [Streptomyces sp. CBMA156]|uniref:hypothetical protein n=1 Tax=Streptomyces sp. CBMA156 TaxID=1930280 RepID=UPI001661D85F|nr:hypothetical protein [Streptomyces sp. CBMA156]MBD0670043.1 hypothetical protein [Streptomyces sp. CBMA156]